MLSFIYRLARQYEREHGHPPNLLHLHPAHFAMLQTALAEIPDLGALRRFLGMEIVIDGDLVHPRVSWSAVDWRRAVAV